MPLTGKTWRPDLSYDFNLKFVIPVCTFNRIVCGRGSAKARKYFFGRFLLPRLKGPSSPYGVIRRRRGMRKFFVLHERKTRRATLKSDSELQFLFPFRLSNRFVCARGSAKARFPTINRWIISRTLRGNTKKAAVRRLLIKTACLGFRLPHFGY